MTIKEQIIMYLILGLVCLTTIPSVVEMIKEINTKHNFYERMGYYSQWLGSQIVICIGGVFFVIKGIYLLIILLSS